MLVSGYVHYECIEKNKRKINKEVKMKRKIFCAIEAIGVVTALLGLLSIDSEGLYYKIAILSVLVGALLTTIGADLNYILDEREKNELICKQIREGLLNNE